ncbi:MAG: hypothetical protein M1840_008547 [Geoglossum simile]|nr:MAG: hypothetical protein M1840_008547 [Geoglossum simile]
MASLPSGAPEPTAEGYGLEVNQSGEIEADENNDTDSALGDSDGLVALPAFVPASIDAYHPPQTSASDTTSLPSSVRNYTYENGRRYHAFKEGEYVLPNDEREQERLDLIHHIFRLNTGGPLLRAPIGKNPQLVLDIGTGTGTEWLSQFRVPPNVQFQVDDAEADWTFPVNHFDYIHGRTLGGSITDMEKLIKQSYKHLKPGGWLEIDECEIWPKSDDGSLTEDHSMWKWFDYLDKSSTQIGKKLNIAETYKDLITNAGFEDVQDDTYKNPLGTWPKDKRLKELGQWIALGTHEGLEPYSLALLTRVLKWDRAKIEALLVEVRKDIRDRSIHAYFVVHFCYGRKPLDEASAGAPAAAS